MKLKTFNRETVPAVTRGGSHTSGMNLLFINQKGVIRFNQELAELLGLKTPGNTVILHQDEERPQDWYIEPTRDPKGLHIRAYMNSKAGCKKPSYMIQSKYLTDLIYQSSKLNPGSYRFIVAAERVDGLHAIITKSAIRIGKKGGEDE